MHGFLAYEKRFAQIMEELNLDMMQAHLGVQPQDYRKKKASRPPSGQ